MPHTMLKVSKTTISKILTEDNECFQSKLQSSHTLPIQSEFSGIPQKTLNRPPRIKE